ncbi:ATP-binding cassette domain-containing protein [Clostridium gasigenes]|uniref:ATP-binding cassette domain-containing protein n=1 Tax=Clostridium gasigenes TaxID=94869 RepID=UPI0014383B82|nr:ATP-binding cassette domain-containing protein [Clostridium gasigenes]NKF07208.1 ATP-binding cassette domain-containing protein [Clostridium gasigenes]QSW18191.1 ATP-binding cassette domain-containing protein [Clostridium gasigenes]
MAFIEINNLDKKIKENLILSNINLKLEKGNIYGIIGRNGSGKTMLFRAICGLIKPTNGNVLIDGKLLGKDIGFPPSCGVIIESCGFWSQYTGYENLKKLASIKNIITDKEIEDILVMVGLDPNDKRQFKKYSLGMKQKLAIAQAIMEKPEILILDEPTNALDEESVDIVRNIILKEKERGALVIIASHNKEDINHLADFKFKMDMGKIQPIIE